MSKLYDKYKLLKSENASKLYLFKNGIFYIFLDDDAIKMSKFLNLKLTKLNETVFKCGFPVKNIDKYLNLLKINNYEIDIVDSTNLPPCSSRQYLQNDEINKFITNIANVDYEHLSITEAFSFIEDIISKAQNLLQRWENYS